MKFLEIKEYNGFKTEFFVLPKTEKFLKEKNIELLKFIPSTKTWYEKILFDYLNIDANPNWKPEKEKNKNFKVVFCGIINDWSDVIPKGFVENMKMSENILQDTSLIINSDRKNYLAIREKIFFNKNGKKG